MKELWFATGSQHLYGEDALAQVTSDSAVIAAHIDSAVRCKVVCKGVVTLAEEITAVMRSANASADCVGVITWMHTFSPSKMWIAGLSLLDKPVLHFHTQFNELLPFADIDMDFMNLNQSAHGDREHAYIYTRMRKNRKVVVGHWKDSTALEEIAVWADAAVAFDASRALKVCRFGDNMREVAVTEGDKVDAQIKFGWSVNGYGIGDLVEEIAGITDGRADELVAEYKSKYRFVTDNIDSVREQAKYELGIRSILEKGGFSAFTTTFEDLTGLKQLPGLAVQRLLGDGYGFGAEGDWKAAAMTRVLKVMSGNDRTAFMEDYTYDLSRGREAILGAHMLEVCPTLAGGEIKIDVQPLGIGGKEDPARMIFDGVSGEAVAVSLVDLGNRFRLIVAEVEGFTTPEPMPKLPVASVMWRPYPDFRSGVKAWLLAGGAHHTVLSFSLSAQHIVDFARMAGIECVVIGKNTDISTFEQQLMLGDVIYK